MAKAKTAPSAAVQAAEAPRMKKLWRDELRQALREQFGYTNEMQIPRLKKITLNMGVGLAKDDKKILQFALADMTAIAGQKPVLTKAKKAVAGFKIRQGMNIGCKVTLRGDRMYEFLDRLITIALPRVRDFEGVPTKSFDGKGNYALGIKEQLIFPEIDFDKTDRIRGLDVIIGTSARTDDEARALLKGFGMPFKVRGGQK